MSLEIKFQSNITHLTSERDQLRDMYTASKEELAKYKTAVNQHAVASENTKSQAQQHSLAVQSMLHRVESERDSALFDLRNMMKERDALVDRLRVIYRGLNQALGDHYSSPVLRSM